MFEESRVVMAIAMLFISLQGALGLMGAVLVYDRIRTKKRP
jgi:hypothetical protein